MSDSGERIRVSFKNDILGTGVFWEGSELDQISNVVARELAEEVRDNPGVEIASCGMWTAEKVKDK